MGDFLELNIRLKLKSETPAAIIDILKYMASLNSQKPVTLPKHDLFSTERWENMLGAYSDPAGAPVKVSIFEKDRYDESWFVLIRSVYKDRGEARLFFNWLYPFIDAGSPDFLGFLKYDSVVQPHLIYYTDEGIHFMAISYDEQTMEKMK